MVAFFAMNFFETIGYYCGIFFRYLWMVINNLGAAITYLFMSQSTIIVIFGFLPTLIGGACAAFVAIAITRFLLMK